jgi:hypothetical protein
MGSVTLAFPEGLSLEAGAPPPSGRIKLGSDDHKNLFCRTLLTTFDPYKPAIIDWPKLDEETQAKITGLPIWDIAVQTEGKAGLRVKTFGEIVTDPLLKRAIELDAFEESRHKHVLANMVEAYGIKLAPEPDYIKPADPEWSFMVTGYSECIDSFFAFGLFEIAKRSGFFPEELVDTFEPVMKEEGRHILFFVNWVAWHRRNMPLWRRPWFALRILGVWAFLIWERMSMGNDLANGQDNNFTVNGAQDLGVEITIPELMDICLAENDRRLGVYDSRLLRPNFVPRMVRLARRFMRTPKPQAA